MPVGKIETGVLNVGKNVVFNPSMKGGEVKSIEMHHTMVDKAEPATTSDSTFVVLPLTTSAVATSLATQTVNQPSFDTTSTSSDKFSSWTSQRLFPSATPLCSTLTPLKSL